MVIERVTRPVVARRPAPTSHDALCLCGHGRSVHGASGSGSPACHACRDACAAGGPCPTAGACCAAFVEVGRVA